MAANQDEAKTKFRAFFAGRIGDAWSLQVYDILDLTDHDGILYQCVEGRSSYIGGDQTGRRYMLSGVRQAVAAVVMKTTGTG